MKKHYLPLLVFMTMVTAMPAAQQATLSAQSVNSHATAVSPTAQPKVLAAKDMRLHAAPLMQRLNPLEVAAKGHRLAPSAASDEATIDTVLLTRVYSGEDNGTLSGTFITYDDCGRRATLEVRDEDGQVTELYRYTYTEGADHKWTEKLIEKAVADDGLDNFTAQSKEVRELDAQNRITSRTIYQLGSNGELEMTNNVTYDYEHPVYDADGNASYGHVADYYEYVDGKQYNYYHYEWLDVAKQYICTHSEGEDIYKTEGRALDGRYIIEEYSRSSAADAWTLVADTEYWVIEYAPGILLNGGKLASTYSNGTLTSCEGTKCVFANNTPEEGWEQWSYYKCGASTSWKWQAYERYEKKGMPRNAGVNGMTGDTAYLRYYSGSDEDTWTLDQTGDFQKFGSDMVRDAVDFYSSGVVTYEYDYFYVKNEDGQYEYNYNIDALGNDEYIYYVTEGEDRVGKYFNVSGFTGEEVMEREISIYPDFSYNYWVGSYTQRYTKDASGEWQPLQEWEVKKSGGWIGTDAVTYRNVYKLNADGKLAQYDQYEQTGYYNDGKEFLLTSEVYSYAETEASVKMYGCNYTDYTSSLNTIKKYALQDDGTVVYTYDYYTDGEVTYQSRTDYNGPITTYYSYDSATKTLKVSDTTYDTYYSEKQADGTYINYEVSYDADHNVLPQKKTESFYKSTDDDVKDHSFMATYTYDAETASWVGESKTESYSVTIPIKWYSSVADPFTSYDDEYSPLLQAKGSSEEQRELFTSKTLYCSKQYAWDAELQEWTITAGSDLTYETDGETYLMWEGNAVDGNASQIEQGVIMTYENHDPMEIGSAVTKVTGSGTVYEQTDVVYDISETGLLMMKQVDMESYDENYEPISYTFEVTNYEYEQKSIYPTSIDRVKGQEMGLTLNGSTISASADASLSLYDVSGRLIARGMGSVSVPSKGVYVVKSSVGSCKVLVK